VKRASQLLQVQRLNRARELLGSRKSASEAALELATRWGLSLRQAARYVQRASACAGPLPMPEAKGVFTVKLPQRLMSQVRARARRQKQPISQWVSQALEQYLHAGPGYG
jgi:hypothetical protein